MNASRHYEPDTMDDTAGQVTYTTKSSICVRRHESSRSVSIAMALLSPIVTADMSRIVTTESSPTDGE